MRGASAPECDLNVLSIRPGYAVFDAEGLPLGNIADLSGDRFLLSAARDRVWVPYDWITIVHGSAVVVNFRPADVRNFRRALASRWARPA